MNLDEALTTIQMLKVENQKLQNRVDFLEEVVYDEIMEDYDDYTNDFDGYYPKYD